MRTQAFRTYLTTKQAALADLARADPTITQFQETLQSVQSADIERTADRTERANRRPFANDPVLARAVEAIPHAAALRKPLHEMVSHLDWYTVFHGPEAPADLSARMHMAPLSWRPNGPEGTGHHVGLFVLHPELDYPAHTHLADEIYLCVSGQLTIRHGVDGTPIHLSPGKASVTPSERLHSLHTGAEPVILAYVWSGDLGAPNWWWQRDDTGAWMRERWQWEENGEWRSYGTEPVGPEIMSRCSPQT
jgi:quercetin dioxygenase-like cupin family protein